MCYLKIVTRSLSFAGVKQESGGNAAALKQNYLAIPPEHKRKSRPAYGGILHFSPDWERAVKHYHSRCRVPASVAKARLLAKPKILQKGSNKLQAATADKLNSLSSYLGSPDNFSPPSKSNNEVTCFDKGYPFLR